MATQAEIKKLERELEDKKEEIRIQEEAQRKADAAAQKIQIIEAEKKAIDLESRAKKLGVDQRVLQEEISALRPQNATRPARTAPTSQPSPAPRQASTAAGTAGSSLAPAATTDPAENRNRGFLAGLFDLTQED